jgi:transcriptional antiterminator Rof (Rho-off)
VVFITEADSVYCAVRAEYLNITGFKSSVFLRLDFLSVLSHQCSVVIHFHLHVAVSRSSALSVTREDLIEK